MASFLTKIFGSRNDRLIKQYRRKVAAINKLEPEMKALSDEQLKAKTAEFRQRLADGASLKHSPSSVRQVSVFSECVTLTCS